MSDALEMAKRHPWWILGGLVVGLLLIQMMRSGSSAPVGVNTAALEPNAQIIAANDALQASNNQWSAQASIASAQAQAMVAIAQANAGAATAQNSANNDAMKTLGLAQMKEAATMGAIGGLTNIFGFGNAGGLNGGGGSGAGNGGGGGGTASGAFGTSTPAYNLAQGQFAGLMQNLIAALSGLGGSSGAGGATVDITKENDRAQISNWTRQFGLPFGGGTGI